MKLISRFNKSFYPWSKNFWRHSKTWLFSNRSYLWVSQMNKLKFCIDL